MIRNNISYTWSHKKAFLQVEKELLGKNTLRGYLHDVDKLFLYLFMSKDTASRIHRKYSRHHDNARKKSKTDYREMIIDWECARITKPDKPLDARATLEKYYPELAPSIEPILKELLLF